MTVADLFAENGRAGWSQISDADRAGLNIALNEATWMRIRVSQATRRAAVSPDVLTLPAEGQPAPGTRLR